MTYGSRLDADACIRTLKTSATVAEAAKKLGSTPRSIANFFKKKGLSHPNVYVYAQTMPAGQELKGNSTYTDAAGNPIARWVKTEKEALEPKFEPVPPGHLISKVTSFLGPDGQVRQQVIQAPRAEADRWERFLTAVADSVAVYEGTLDPIECELPTPDTDLMAVYPAGDPHIGMLSWRNETGEDFDLSIAEREFYGTVDTLVRMTPAAHVGLLVDLGDFFHAENDKQATPKSGHKLDVDSRIAKVSEVGINIIRRSLDRMLQNHAEVWALFVRGNHDPSISIMLSACIKALYSREPRVKVLDNSNPYTYVEFGKNLLGFAHGDGAKPHELPGIMAHDRREIWGRTLYQYWLLGHRHHSEIKEYKGTLVETCRTLAPNDYFAHHAGYRSGHSLDSLTFHREYGRIGRASVDIRLARHAASSAA
jgi:hypothetical protein